MEPNNRKGENRRSAVEWMVLLLCITEKSCIQISGQNPIVRIEDFPGLSDSIGVNAGILPPVRLHSPN
jgi:hypothetical protein